MERRTHDEIIGIQHRLERSELILEEMEAAAKIGGYILDTVTGEIFWTRGMHRIYETDPMSFVPTLDAIMGFYPPETASLVQQNRRRLLDLSVSEFALDLEVVTAKSNRIWIHAITRADVRDGKVVRIFGTALDITARKRAEDALRDREQSYRSLFAFNSSIMVLVDPSDGCIIDANMAAVNFYGYPYEQLRSMRITDINTLPADEVLSAMDSITIGRGRRFVFHHRLADGSLRDVEISSCRIQSNGRTIIHSIVYDITERTRTEEALRELEERYRLIYENSGEAILFTSPDGTIYSANPEACRILGRSEAEIREVGRNGLIDRSDPRLPGALEHRRRTGMFKGELNFVRADGTLFPAEITTNIFLDSQGHERTSMFIRDMTEKNVAESLLRQSNEDLRHLSDHLTTVRENERRLIAREVHDELGQVFTALKMEVMALLRTITADTEEISPRAYSIMQMIEAGIKSVQHISSSLRPRLLDDFGLIPAIEWQAEEFQKRTEIPVTLSVPREDLAVPKEVATAVFRIIQESLTNILRHASATRISIELCFDPNGSTLVFTIEDNGKGITEDAVTSPNSFGLIGIRERLRALGGRVEFTNHEHGGTRVMASIPMHQ